MPNPPFVNDNNYLLPDIYPPLILQHFSIASTFNRHFTFKVQFKIAKMERRSVLNMVRHNSKEALRVHLHNNPEDANKRIRGCTILYYAIVCRAFECFKLLVNRGARTESINNHKADALFCAVTVRHRPMIRFLLARRVSVYGGEQWTSILTPILEKDDVITLRLLCQYDGNLASASIDTGFTSQSAVVNSIRLGAAKCTRFLLNFVTNAQNIMTDDVQHCALMTAINELDADTVIQISRLPGFSEGLNTNRFDNGATYLHLAVAVNPTATNHRKKDTIVKVLLRAGADVNFRDRSWNTPIFWASNVDTACVLVLRGADLHIKNARGLTPRENCKHNETKQRLAEWFSLEKTFALDNRRVRRGLLREPVRTTTL